MGDSGAQHGRSHTHVCQVFDDQSAFRDAAVEFLAAGLAGGHRVRYVTAGDAAADLAPLRDLPQWRPGAVEVEGLEGTYGRSGACVDPAAQVEVYAAATRAAVADGFAGLRVAADATVLVRTAAQLDAFARYEHEVDRFMTGAPFSAMCGYRRPALSDDAVALLACLHPDGSAERAPFRMHATPGADVALSGELDLTTVALFAAAVDRTGLAGRASEVVVDATGLDFADHRNLLVLQRMADRYGRSVVLRTARRWPARLAAALELTRIRVEHPG